MAQTVSTHTEGPINALALSRDGSHVVVAGRNGEFLLIPYVLRTQVSKGVISGAYESSKCSGFESLKQISLSTSPSCILMNLAS